MGWLKDQIESINSELSSVTDELEIKISDAKSMLELATT